ncbi:hypothetical protein [Subtercola boreus]|uniref:hypothetical protein n=1 Tax=Subtercola boreus TaxID=120213 RepID=UPI0011C03ED1|nr:hypothetical protein [Subtercola boreus]
MNSGRESSLANWVKRSSSAALIRLYVTNETPLTHESLDAWPSKQTATHVRQLFLATGLLPAREETLRRFDIWTLDYLIAQPGPHHQMLQRYARWHVSPALQNKATRRPLRAGSTSYARQQIRTAARFLQTLPHDVPATGHVQFLIEDYVLEHPRERDRLVDFIRWTQKHNHLPHAELAYTAMQHPRVALAESDYWAAISTLQTDTSISLRARVAGLLVGLFGQQLTRIVQLTADNIYENDGAVQLLLGADPITLPHTLAQLVTKLRNTRPPWTAEAPDRWLFPSKFHPNRHIHLHTIADDLRKHGIYTIPLRGASLTNLAGHIPIGPLCDMTGLSKAAAIRWADVAGRSWNAYPQLRTEH